MTADVHFQLPDDFIRRNQHARGAEGRAWLEQLPTLVAECAARWSLTLGPPVPDLSYNWVAPATRADGTRVFFKSSPVHPDTLAEITALRHYDGRGAARLLDADLERGAMLLERLEPGTQLAALEDDAAATAIATRVMTALWRPAPPGIPLPTLADTFAGLGGLRAMFDGGTGPLPERIVAQAEELIPALLATSAPAVILHGDLHHYNILAAGPDDWRAIDPHGVLGEPAAEVGAFLRNPTPQIGHWPDLDRILARRVAQLADDLGFERRRLRDWGIAIAVLSAWWSTEGGSSRGSSAIACAEALARLQL